MVYFYIFITVQIIAESFPMSSSGHIALLMQHAEKWELSLPAIVYAGWFNHFLHMPTALIVFLFFKKQWWVVLSHVWRCRILIIRTLLYVGIADIVTALLYFIFKIIGVSWFPLGLGFCVTIGALYSTRWYSEVTTTTLSLSTAIIIGLVQGVALLPGISRFAVTYTVARFLAFSPERSFALSWMIQWPLIVLASVHGVFELYWCSCAAELLRWPVWFVMLGATIGAWGGMYMMSAIVQKNMMWVFAMYMMIPLAVWIRCIML